MQPKPVKPASYCDFVKQLDPSNPHRIYHDLEYGFPGSEDKALFELLVLEINQAGLSWNTILNKRENFRKAYDFFDVEKVASYGDADIQRLLNNPGIIRNRLKIDAAIHNANVILELQKDFGSFRNWLDTHHPKTREEWTKLFRKTFKFTGGEIVNEFLMSTGHLPGAHVPDCPVYSTMVKANPPHLRE
jgi:DNA-3-methyladenine glycosylase I